MLKTFLSGYFPSSLKDWDYSRYEEKLANINIERIRKFSLIIAIAVILFAAIPDILIFLSIPELTAELSIPVLILQLSVTLFMLLFYWIAPSFSVENKPKSKNIFINAFISIVLLHAAGTSIATYSSSSEVSVFLFTTAALMVGLYWSAQQLILLLGTAHVLYFLALYFTVQEASIWYTHLLDHLLFGSIFFLLSRSVHELKARNLKSIEKIEAQSAELRSSHTMLRMTEHTLNSLNRNMQQGIFRLDRKNGFTYANDHFAQMLGYNSANELITEQTVPFLSVQQLEEISRKVNEQGFIEGMEVEVSRRNKNSSTEKFWVQLSCAVRRDENTGSILYEGSATDISHRKKVLQAALENAAKLEQAEKIAHTGFYEINVGTGLITYSAGLCKILGIDAPAPLKLQQHLEYIHPDDREQVRNTLLQAITRNSEFTLEYRAISHGGSVCYLNSKAGLIRDEKGNKIKILGTVQDVSQIQLNRQALALSESYVEAAFNNPRHSIYILDLDYHLLAFNHEASWRLKLWWKVDLKKGMHIPDVIPPAALAQLKPHLKRAASGESSLLEYKGMNSTDEEYWTEVYFCPVKNSQGEVSGIMVMGSNITERKMDEKLLSNLSLVASHTDNAVMISDADFRVEWVNGAFERSTGYNLQDIKGHFPASFLLSEKTNTETIRRINSCLQEGKSFKDEILICDKSKKDRWMYLTINPVFNSAGELHKFVSVYTNLDKVKAYEQQLQIAKERAELVAESKENFLSSVSHELRTPLNAVIGLTHHMLENEPREDQLEDLNILKFSAENLLNLINDILDLSKIEAGKVKIEKVPFKPEDVINRLKQSFLAQAEAKGLSFRVYLNDHIPEQLLGDPHRLIQILTNLLSNAIKFTPKGSVEVYLSADLSGNGGYALTISVKDTGRGIAPEQLDLIFDKFEQAPQDRDQYVGGTGLGLSITRQLVELQNGEISVNSTPGQGSTFTVTLPYSVAPESETLLPEPSTTGSEADLSRLHLLLVEDNKINQTVAGKFLKSWGISFTLAENGMEAVAAAKEKAFDLILMDLQLPLMDGYEASRLIRRLTQPDHRTTPIIAVTAGGKGGIEQRVREAGMNSMLSKPFKPDALLNKLRQYCPYQRLNKSSMNEGGAGFNHTVSGSEVDFSEMERLAGDDPTFMQELIRLYIEQFRLLREEALNGLNAQDTAELRRIFHKMKPSISMLRQERMLQLSSKIHQLLHNEFADISLISALSREFIEEMDRTSRTLQKALEKSSLTVKE
ncbi:PAS domain S-box protein [Nafulsella turpanensis]|uniref:PAS domain S-box protein n=1 Tax=Nafulsella turpanensis TaxID=1265690 RepID=UPI000348FB6C|nr:PAS domain S-box protein [Nafulsella turpanensis]